MIRFGIIGTSIITDEFIRSAQLIEGFSLNAVYSRTKERVEEFANKYDVKNIFTELEEMAESDLIDAIYIASPNSFHAEQSILFLKNNKHVLCEKPIASNLKEVNEMIEAAKENEVLLMEAMKSIPLPNFQTIKENLNKIGKIRRYCANYCQYSSRYDSYKEGKNPNTFNPKFSNGSLMDIGVYCIYPLIALFGSPNKIKANGLLLDSGVDGEGSLILEYDEMEAVIIHSKISDSVMTSEIQGEKGTIIIDKISEPREVQIKYRDGEVESINDQQLNPPMYYEINEFIKLIKEQKYESAINSHSRSIEVMKVIEEARRQIGIIYPADREVE